jgi:hypothetical protein
MTGQALRDNISREANSMFSQSPYSMFHPSGSWQGNQFVVTGNGISGGITIAESGGGADVSVNLELSGSAAIGASAARTRFQEIFARLGGTTGTADPSAPSTSSTGQPTTQTQEPARPRLQVDWGIATTVISTLGTSIAGVFDSMARGTAQEVAQQYGVDQSTVNQSIVTNPSVTKGQYAGTKVTPSYQPMAPQPVEEQGAPAPVVNGDTGFVMPTWGWAAIGIGGAAMIGFVLYLASRK